MKWRKVDVNGQITRNLSMKFGESACSFGIRAGATLVRSCCMNRSHLTRPIEERNAALLRTAWLRRHWRYDSRHNWCILYSVGHRLCHHYGVTLALFNSRAVNHLAMGFSIGRRYLDCLERRYVMHPLGKIGMWSGIPVMDHARHLYISEAFRTVARFT